MGVLSTPGDAVTRGTVGYFASQAGSPVEMGCASALIELVSDEKSALPELQGQNKGLKVTGPRRGTLLPREEPGRRRVLQSGAGPGRSDPRRGYLTPFQTRGDRDAVGGLPGQLLET